MPPKVKVTKDDIVKTALALVREQGAEALNARAVAAALNCSTQPVFSNFASMEELRSATVNAAYECYLECLRREAERGEYPPYKAFGMAYVRFANEEKNLFQLLFMRNRRGEAPAPSPDFEASVELISAANGVSREKAELLHLEMWTCVHGIGTMLATSYLSLEWELIGDILTDIYQGIRARHLSKENE